MTRWCVYQLEREGGDIRGGVTGGVALTWVLLSQPFCQCPIGTSGVLRNRLNQTVPARLSEPGRVIVEVEPAVDDIVYFERGGETGSPQTQGIGHIVGSMGYWTQLLCDL